VDDRELVAALRSGDAHSLTAVHDAYANQLYDYAHGLLHDREAAEDAVHDALLVAVGRNRVLRETHRARAWLYALTRNECLRQMKRSRMASRPRVADSRDETVFFGDADLRTEQARAWIRDAVAGLAPHRREVLDLTVRHRLTEIDVATITGVNVRRTTARIRAARTDLNRALDSLLIARAGHGVCTDLDALLAGWDGLFTRAVHQRVSAHAANCRTCAAGGSARGNAADRYAELPMTPVPSAFRTRLLGTAAVHDRIVYRGEIAEPFLRSGFPAPLDSAKRRRLAVLWGGAALVSLALVGGLLYLISGDADESARTAGTKPGPGIEPVEGAPASPSDGPSTTPTASTSPTATPTASPTATPTASPSTTALPPSPRPTRPGGGSDPGTRVDALLADSTVGCPRTWRATVTGNIRGNEVRQVIFYWGETSARSNAVRLAKVNDGIYQAEVKGLPMDVTLSWEVVATTNEGRTASSGINTARHPRQC
jgi:RNA polymerase sigma factor (sigma-70 family)